MTEQCRVFTLTLKFACSDWNKSSWIDLEWCVLFSGEGNSKISSVYINNTHGADDDDFYDRNLALFEV